MPMPCNFDHNGECLVCDGWPSECAWAMLVDGDFKKIPKEKLIDLLEPYMNEKEKRELC